MNRRNFFRTGLLAVAGAKLMQLVTPSAKAGDVHPMAPDAQPHSTQKTDKELLEIDASYRADGYKNGASYAATCHTLNFIGNSPHRAAFEDAILLGVKDRKNHFEKYGTCL